jgi:hypothetical protein
MAWSGLIDIEAEYFEKDIIGEIGDSHAGHLVCTA